MFIWTINYSWISFIIADIFGIISFFSSSFSDNLSPNLTTIALMGVFLVLGVFFSLLRIFQLRLDIQLNQYKTTASAYKKEL